ncbi:hypothetical protein DL768_006412 [Monosporascus sp. mg162]|nr:hypothetical protein DL768_006412 [Monosporascus sp. mg162]
MPSRQSSSHWRRFFHRRGHASEPGESKKQDAGTGRDTASAPFDVSIVGKYDTRTSTTNIDVSQTQPSHAPAISEFQPNVASNLKQTPASAFPFPSPLPDTLATPASNAAISADMAASLSERLWDRAYDDLKLKEAPLIQAYEKILSRKLCGRELDSPVDESEPNAIAQDDRRARQSQMRQLIRAGLEKTSREAKVKENIGTAIQVVLSMKSMISSAVQVVPQAALAWTGMLENPIAETESNRNGIEYVIKRMDWYWELSGVLLKKNTVDDDDLSGVRRELETQIVDLYKALLLYEIKSVCSYYRNRGLALLRDVGKLDDWDGDMDAIRNAEGVFRDDSNIYTGQKMTSHLDRLVTHVKNQETIQMTEKDQQCLKDLRLTDPRDDKTRIEQTKGGLLRDSYRWILDNPDFRKWRDNEQSRLLWIKADPGKGKTMLLCGIIDELQKSTVDMGLVSFFFCQATDSRINHATAVLRGLLYLLVDEQPSLIRHVRGKYDHAGKALFEDANAWVALSEIFTSLLQDLSSKSAYIIIDALDECQTDLPQLLDFIVQNSSASSRIKWVVSSRNWLNIEERLEMAGQKVILPLELNADSVSNAVAIYIRYKVLQLSQLKKYDRKTEGAVLGYLSSNANDTFLWVALVCQSLEKVSRLNALARLKTFPPGLDSLYERMMQQIRESDDVDLCKEILVFVTTVYRPITLNELTSFVELPEATSDNLEPWREAIGLCGSFLTIREGTVYFVHQSAKDFLLRKASGAIFPSGVEEAHRMIFSRSLEVMTGTLRRDIYCLGSPGFPIDQAQQPEPDPLAAARYSCVYWVYHLDSAKSVELGADIEVGGIVDQFLRRKYLYWLEALSLLRSMADGVLSMMKLAALFQGRAEASGLIDLVRDANRFILYHKWVLENFPLQAYASALLFSPARSLTRELFKQEEPEWITIKPDMGDNWGACLQTLEGHVNEVNSVAFSHHDMYLASGSDDNTVKLWDAATGKCIQTLEGHGSWVNSVAFSHDDKHLASGSSDTTIKIWDTATSKCIQALEGHRNGVVSVAFSHNSKYLASGSSDETIKIWDAGTNKCTQTLEGHRDKVTSVTFSHNSKYLASGSYDKTIKIWDTATGKCIQTFEGHNGPVLSVALSYDGRYLASELGGRTVKIWDIATFQHLLTLEGHGSHVLSIAFSYDGKYLASASRDNTARVWDASTGKCIQTLEGHGNQVVSVTYSHNKKQLATGSYDDTVKIWDTAGIECVQKLEAHGRAILSTAFSHNHKQLATGSTDNTVKIWDVATVKCIKTLEGHGDKVTSVTFSQDDNYLASGSHDTTVKIWYTITGKCAQTFEGHDGPIVSVAFSQKYLASAPWGGTVKIWDIATGTCLQTLDCHGQMLEEGGNYRAYIVTFSHNDKYLAFDALDKTVKVWDITTGICIHTLEGHGGAISSITFSQNDKHLASSSRDKTVKIWDAATGKLLQTLDTRRTLWDISFDPTGFFLYTDMGILLLDILSSTNAAARTTSFQELRCRGYGLSSDGVWVTKHSENLLWLPAEYRASRVAIRGSTVAVGCGSGRLLIFSFGIDNSFASEPAAVLSHRCQH